MSRAAWVLTLLVACVPQDVPDASDSDEVVVADTDSGCADGRPKPTWHVDEDGDGLGVDNHTVDACAAPEGYAPEGGDCDDRDATLPAWRYEDVDRDGYGGDTLLFDCEHQWRATVSGDCDDHDPTVYPGAPAICSDGLVNDCDASEEDLCRYDGWYELGVVGPSVIGTERMGHLTWGLAVVGDVDGNGTDDIVAGARNASPTEHSAGVAYLITRPSTDDVDSASVARLIGTTEREHVGDTAARAGDLDGDGVPDLAVRGAGAGVFLFSGALRGDHAATKAAFAYLPGAPYVEGIMGGFDWTGDGDDDLAASTTATDDRAGLVRIFAGPLAGEPEPWATITGTSAEQQLGRRLARVADMDGDGGDELVAQAMPFPYLHSGGGELYLLTQPKTGTTAVEDVATAHLYGLDHEYIGETIGSGDIDGDGYGDMLMSALAFDVYVNQDVAARLVLGPIVGEHLAADVACVTLLDREGGCHVVDVPGDVDGDGFDDMLVACPSDGHPTLGGMSGAVHLVYGGPSLCGTVRLYENPVLTESDAVFYGVPGDVAGQTLAGGDFDGDGYADFAVGARDHSTADPGVGALYIVFGQPW